MNASERLSQNGGLATHLCMTTQKLTRLQEDVLGIVRECGPVTVADVAYHLPIGEPSARGVLSRLEAKGLIDATYTATVAATGALTLLVLLGGVRG